MTNMEKLAEKLVLSLNECEFIIPAGWAGKKRQEALRKVSKRLGVDMYIKLTRFGLVAGARPKPADIERELV